MIYAQPNQRKINKINIKNYNDLHEQLKMFPPLKTASIHNRERMLNKEVPNNKINNKLLLFAKWLALGIYIYI